MCDGGGWGTEVSGAEGVLTGFVPSGDGGVFAEARVEGDVEFNPLDQCSEFAETDTNGALRSSGDVEGRRQEGRRVDAGDGFDPKGQGCEGPFSEDAGGREICGEGCRLLEELGLR